MQLLCLYTCKYSHFSKQLVASLSLNNFCCSGSMRWPNGDRYDGEFMFGKFHGYVVR